MAKAAAVLLLTMVAVATAVKAQPNTATRTLFEILGSDSNLSTLVQAVNATSVINLLVTPRTKPVTVLAPNNKAFAALLAASNLTFPEVAATVNALTTVLVYHVVDGLYNQSNITDGAKLPTLLPKPRAANSSDPVQYEELTAIVNATGIFVQGTGNTARILGTIDALGVNGIVHEIDVLLKPPTPQLTAAYELDDLAKAAAASTFVSSPPNITIINTTIINSTMVNSTNTSTAAAGRRRTV